MKKTRLKELQDAVEYYYNSGIMVEETVLSRNIDIEQLEADKEIIKERAKRLVDAIERFME